jgi:SP family general alpha glucoside:H+ symporter-like MFS transporter
MDASKEVKESAVPQGLSREVISDAEQANTKDHNLTILQAFRIYPKAVPWSALLSAACIMDGYDLKLFGLLFAQPAFNKAYGKLQANGTYQISAAWQQGLNNGSNIGQMIGLTFAGQLSERLGFRKTMIATLLVVPCIIFIQFFATSLAVLEVGQIFLGESEIFFETQARSIQEIQQQLTLSVPIGIPLGIFQTATWVYAVEVAPTCLRGFLTSWVSQNWVSLATILFSDHLPQRLTSLQVIGQIIASCVTRGVLGVSAPWAYRIPFAIQWVPP